MAFVENAAKRQPNSIVLEDGSTRQLISSPIPLHYFDGSSYQRINMAPNRVNNAQFDGWRVTANGYHFALGQPAGQNDGWLGFGGKRGQHWFQFRLRHVGYLHKPTGTPILLDNWTHISSGQPQPDYDRANLTRQTHTLSISGLDLNRYMSIEWRNLWSTPGGGELYTRWRAEGGRLKEEIVINQIGREWIAANRPPSTPAGETWFGFVFELDWSDIPRRVVNGVLRQAGDDFNDSAGGVELQNALGELLAFMPLDFAYVPSDDPFLERVQLRKRFWQDNDGRHYLLIGALVSNLNSLPAGDLIFDPTITPSVSAGADDGVWSTAGFSNSDPATVIGNFSSLSLKTFFRFDGITISGSDTIDDAAITFIASSTASATTVNVTILAVDEDDASAISSQSDGNGRATTSASVAWNNIGSQTSGNPYNTPDFAAVVQEVIDRGGWAAGNALVMLLLDNASSNNAARFFAAYDHATLAPALLTIDYTAGGHDLSLDDVAAGTPTVDSPTLGQTHVLSVADAIAQNPTIESPTLGQTHILTTSDVIAQNPAVDDLDVSESHALALEPVEAQNPTVGSPTLGQTHVLSVADATTQNPTVESPTLGQTHILSLADVTAQNPTIESPTLGQTHILATSDVISQNPIVDSPTLGQTHVLSVADVAAQNPTVESPTLGQTHILSVADVTAQNPTIESPTLGQTHILSLADVTAGTPVVDDLTVQGAFGINTDPVYAQSPVVDSPTLGQTHVLSVADAIAQNPTIESPTLGQTHILSASDVIAQNPVVDDLDVQESHALALEAVEAQNPTVDSPTLGQTHVLSAADVIAQSPVVSSPSVQESHALTLSPVEAQNPTVDSPTLGQTHVLIILAIVAGSPSVESLALDVSYSGPPGVQKRNWRRPFYEGGVPVFYEGGGPPFYTDG